MKASDVNIVFGKDLIFFKIHDHKNAPRIPSKDEHPIVNTKSKIIVSMDIKLDESS